MLVPDCLVYTQNETRRLSGRLKSIDLDQSRLPHKAFHHVGSSLVLEVNAGPQITPPVLNAQTVEDISGIKASIVAELAGNNLQCLGKALDNGLLLMRDVAVSKPVQVGR